MIFCKRSCQQTVIPQDRERVARWASDCLAEQKGNEIEYQIAWPNGDLRTVSCVSEISRGEDGLPTRMFGACRDITDVKKNEAKLVQAQEDLLALTARLVEHQELGMKELARELRDDLSQNLAALGREIETLLPLSTQPSRSLSDQAHEIWRRVTKLASDVHSMSQRLHPTILDDLGLKEALIEQCWAFSERTGIPVQFESAGESTRPAADVSLCFYRVAQEGLHNIAKHAGATSVHVALSSSEEQCTLRIEDNGQGFDPSEAKGKNALGLISMRERARLVNGNFTIRSEYGKGTMLEVSVILKTN
jgi:signal transduction histidine kinase